MQVCAVRFLRLPDPSPKLEMIDLNEYKAMPGFAHQVMVDLQRIFACLEVEKKGGDGNGSFDEDYVVAVSRQSEHFSKRILLSMNSMAQWRTAQLGAFRV